MAWYTYWSGRIAWAGLHIFIYAYLYLATAFHDAAVPLNLITLPTVATYLALQFLDPGYLPRDDIESSLPIYRDQERICDSCGIRQPLRTKHW